jgi:outer membrane protein assembly factor BamB
VHLARKPRVPVLLAAALALAGLIGVGGLTGGAVAQASSAHPTSVRSSDWTTFDQNGLRDGVDTSGNSFSPATPAWTSPTFDGQLYGQPLEATGRVFVGTENDTVYALAADSGHVLWSHHLGTPLNPNNVPNLCGNIGPTVGITGTPVIDLARSEIFVVATLASGTSAVHRLIGLDIYTGALLLSENIDPASIPNPAFELQRVSLALTDNRVIIGMGGNAGDCGDYHGLVISAPENGAAPTAFIVANMPNPPDNQGAVWMAGAAPSIDSQGNVWVATGNSAYHDSSDPYDDSDGVLKLSATAKAPPLDFFAPSQWYNDNAGDADLGSTTPALLPNGLVFEVGKSRTAYILSQSHLGHIGGQLKSASNFCGSDPDGGAADLNGTLFVPCSDGLRAVRPTDATPSALWKTTSGAQNSPIVAGGLVWSIGGNTLFALDPATGHPVQQFTIGYPHSHFPSPSAADGLVLAPADNHVDAFKGPAGLPGPPSPPTSPQPPCICGPRSPGYYLAGSDGGIFSFGGGGFYGSTGALTLNQPVVGLAVTPESLGYWLVASDGGIFNFGDAGFHGSLGSLHLNRPIVGMAPTPDGKGYWLVASDGGVFALGDAHFYGSTGAIALNRPIVGMAATPNGGGYWLVASDGGIFAFGNAQFKGSTGAIALNRPIVGMAATPDGNGYWLVATDGGVFSFGDAVFRGSTGAIALNRPVVGMAATPDGDGYWLVASDGGVFSFGDAVFKGSTGAIALNRPIVGIAQSLSAP